MHYKFVYENNRGQRINLSEHPYYLDIEPLLDYQWSYSQKEKRRGNIIAGFAKDIQSMDLTLNILARETRRRDEAIDAFNNLIEADIYDGIAGKIWLNDWYTRGYIISSQNTKWQYGKPIVQKKVKLVREQENWYHSVRVGNFGNTEQEEAFNFMEEDIKTFERVEGADTNSLKSLTATINPKQDLHGYDKPWVGGAGKNKMPPVIGGTYNGVTATVHSDGSVTLNGTNTSGNSFFRSDYFTLKAGTYIITGGLSDGNSAVYLDGVSGSASAGARLTISEDTQTRSVVQVYSGKTANYTVYPMLRLATVTDDTYEPYSNICPISGWDSVEAYDDHVYGGTVVWNQLVPTAKKDFANTVVDTKTKTLFYVRKSDTPYTTLYYTEIENNFSGVKQTIFKANFTGLIEILHSGSVQNLYVLGGSDNVAVQNGHVYAFNIDFISNDVTTVGGFHTDDLQLIDLTHMFGSAKADEIYAMEQAQRGSGVAYFKSLFPKDYYPYNAGEETTVSAVNGDPYTHITVTLPETVYGGSLDVVNGVLTVTHGIVTLNIADMNNSEAFPGWKNLEWIDNMKQGTSASAAPRGSIMNIHPYASNMFSLNRTTKVLFLPTAVYGMNMTEWKTTYPDLTVQIVYPLAEPRTIQLTPKQVTTLLGTNNVWADAGNVTVEYWDDTGRLATASGSVVTFSKRNVMSGTGYDYAYDYMADIQSQQRISNPNSTPCEFIISIQGYVNRPVVQIGENVIAVDVEVPYGANLQVDSSAKTAILTLADGTMINVFGARDPDYYLFARIPSGNNIVTWNGSFMWEVKMLEERSEPRWLTD